MVSTQSTANNQLTHISQKPNKQETRSRLSGMMNTTEHTEATAVTQGSAE